MAKLAVLKISEGSFDQGFSVTFQLGVAGERPTTEMMGKLPPAPEMPLYYSHWQSRYRQMGGPLRLSAPAHQVTNVSLTQDCCQAAQILRARLNTWLRSEDFRPIREIWLERLHPDDEVRVILQSQDSQMQQLPWHLVELLERYPKAELAISAPSYDRPTQTAVRLAQVKILAILGDSHGIDTATDRALLDQLPQATVNFLVEPPRQHLTEQLWHQPWDILFFAGHSSSQAGQDIGRIYLNPQDSLTMGELKYALRQAVERGLQLAIFNSCDGLGLARELADLHIPQVIVMREPVPDQVAQTFLKYFLTAFAGGLPLYRAVRQAREQLQGVEDRFPCASWLPLIYQNPAALPPTWQELFLPPPSRARLTPARSGWGVALVTSLVASLVATGTIGSIRSAGGLQPLELKAFDHLMQQRDKLQPEKPDSRLFIITIDDHDIQQQRQRQEDLRGLSLSDRSLNQLLAKLEGYQPLAIGLDLYRDFAADIKQPQLAARLKRLDNLVGVCKVSDPPDDPSGVAPPPELAATNVGFSDFVHDPDEGLRRHLLLMNNLPARSPCQANFALSTQLALRYLAAQGITATISDQGLQLHSQTKVNLLPFDNPLLARITPTLGGYQNLDAGGGQILLNYRATKMVAPTVTLAEFHQLKPPELKQAIANRVILIGVTAQASPDQWKTSALWQTPYGATTAVQMPGVIVQAHMVSQLLSAALDGRPLLWAWSGERELWWIGGWSGLGGLVGWRLWNQAGQWRSLLQLTVAVGVLAVSVYGICLIALTYRGGWLPLVPGVGAIVVASGSVVVGKIILIPKSSGLTNRH